MLQTDFEAVYSPDYFELVHIDYAVSTPEALHAHWDQYGPTFPVLVGCGSLFSEYSNAYIPYNIIIDADGVLRYSRQGFFEEDLHEVISQSLPVPLPVDDLSIQVAGGMVMLSWSAVEGASGYRVFASSEPYGRFTAQEATVELPEFEAPVASMRHHYQVRAILEVDTP